MPLRDFPSPSEILQHLLKRITFTTCPFGEVRESRICGGAFISYLTSTLKNYLKAVKKILNLILYMVV
ncbi:hypothetical protein HMPREF9073_02606 [Capnocytophaga sp. oral taxon 326 str. F0382]|nr:hypothetical protein HMPREF9073_02606 [Capnocytophaga sp. oral taxon 326 str. F0382]